MAASRVSKSSAFFSINLALFLTSGNGEFPDASALFCGYLGIVDGNEIFLKTKQTRRIGDPSVQISRKDPTQPKPPYGGGNPTSNRTHNARFAPLNTRAAIISEYLRLSQLPV